MTPFLPSFKGPALAEQVSAAAKKIENLESKVPYPFGVLSPAAGVCSDNPSNRILLRFRRGAEPLEEPGDDPDVPVVGR